MNDYISGTERDSLRKFDDNTQFIWKFDWSSATPTFAYENQ